ncbi:mitochondrial 37S ribosomal protein uS5m KNAG_0L01070 [Huiozyma naganishii CBS 8797]|uniref:Small ribosomal subunit protein uS5m n=1 Tax=Huiozyma naganishii (strain ATCC MYA-139 / BCRC 22969 / CBS 8797 / KCTC 17520 / NBRC 10181 / NCYC 3082 / Yp74L-3) TaxID=1071383 RepID=J7RS55_HUIN7|nr:hypothetical protein KNAG_0L01070 [Kazachstania naganishii CBS 8797]CCK72728.1 hypothetical protein KNAG_0L01070 [Kazachstania naganishii CBS 8797]
MWRRLMSSAGRAGKSAPLAPYYSAEMLKAVELGESVLPSWMREGAGAGGAGGRDDVARVDGFWDYDPRVPHEHAAQTGSQQVYTPSNSGVQGNGTARPLPPPGSNGAVYPDEVLQLATQTRISKMALLAAGIHRQTQTDPAYVSRRLQMKPLVLKRVSNQTGKGKIASHYALCVVGDRNGMVGLGEGKSRADMAKALGKAHWDAIRNLTAVERFEDRTVLRDTDYKFHGSRLFVRRREAGFGVRTNHVIFEICQLAGIKDLSAKVYGSRNEMNIAKGFLELLTTAQGSLRDIAAGRGKKIVDVRKTYYGGGWNQENSIAHTHTHTHMYIGKMGHHAHPDISSHDAGPLCPSPSITLTPYSIKNRPLNTRDHRGSALTNGKVSTRQR